MPILCLADLPGVKVRTTHRMASDTFNNLIKLGAGMKKKKKGGKKVIIIYDLCLCTWIGPTPFSMDEGRVPLRIKTIVFCIE